MKRFLLALFISSLFFYTEVFSQSFSIEDILSSSMPTNLTISAGEKVAWVENKEGARNIWLASAPGYEAIMITNYQDDDGQGDADL